jgi:hypothetical protein
MKNYRYRLEPYKGIKTRYTCPQCGRNHAFVRYIDAHTGQHLGNDIGRCNREQQCGYHVKPNIKSEYLNPTVRVGNTKSQNPNSKTYNSNFQPALAAFYSQLCTIHQQSLCCYSNNHLMLYIFHKYGWPALERVIDTYRIGTHGNDTIFWQIDVANNIRAGKVMAYDKHTGKRIKDGVPAVRWVHSIHPLQGYELRQCLFGEHLLRTDNRPVAIAESEKTALICSICLPQYLWLATGGIRNLTVEKCQVLRGRRVVLFPDAGAYDVWHAIGQQIPHCTTSQLLMHHTDGSDLGDWM